MARFWYLYLRLLHPGLRLYLCRETACDRRPSRSQFMLLCMGIAATYATSSCHNLLFFRCWEEDGRCIVQLKLVAKLEARENVSSSARWNRIGGGWLHFTHRTNLGVVRARTCILVFAQPKFSLQLQQPPSSTNHQHNGQISVRTAHSHDF